MWGCLSVLFYGMGQEFCGKGIKKEKANVLEIKENIKKWERISVGTNSKRKGNKNDVAKKEFRKTN